MGTYASKLKQRITAIRSSLCVGLDPRPDQIDGEIDEFLSRVIDETLPYAAAFKPNFAYFEAMGIPGLRLLETLRERIPSDVPLLLDVKRSDIGETQSYYARAAFDVWGADAVTLNPWLGFDSIEPFLQFPDKGLYLLCVTSNPGAAEFALQKMGDHFQFEKIQAMVDRGRELAPGIDIGLVAGLTNLAPEVVARIADVPLLVPGLGAQGGDLAALAATPRHAPNLVNVTRGILYREPERSFADKAADYAARVRDALLSDPSNPASEPS